MKMKVETKRARTLLACAFAGLATSLWRPATAAGQDPAGDSSGEEPLEGPPKPESSNHNEPGDSDEPTIVNDGKRRERRDLGQDVRALEMAGFRGMAAVLLTSDPVGSKAVIDRKRTCPTPCRLTLPPGKYQVVFSHREREDAVIEVDVTSEEQVQVHAVLGRRTMWKLIVPAYFVGSIFTAGGVSSILVHGGDEPQNGDETELTADERRFHRNLGIASVSVGIPVLIMATYLLLTGRPGEVQMSVAPGTPAAAASPSGAEVYTGEDADSSLGL